LALLAVAVDRHAALGVGVGDELAVFVVGPLPLQPARALFAGQIVDF
jgi:hypothetical protein